jgi:hypothetical protein
MMSVSSIVFGIRHRSAFSYFNFSTCKLPAIMTKLCCGPKPSSFSFLKIIGKYPFTDRLPQALRGLYDDENFSLKLPYEGVFAVHVEEILAQKNPEKFLNHEILAKSGSEEKTHIGRWHYNASCVLSIHFALSGGNRVLASVGRSISSPPDTSPTSVSGCLSVAFFHPSFGGEVRSEQDTFEIPCFQDVIQSTRSARRYYDGDYGLSCNPYATFISWLATPEVIPKADTSEDRRKALSEKKLIMAEFDEKMMERTVRMASTLIEMVD